MALKELDYVLVPAGLLVLLSYHGWLIYAIRFMPRRTVIGLNVESRHHWVHCLMTTLRNNMMATTQLATIAITLSSLITALVSSSSSSSTNVSSSSIQILNTTYSYTSVSLTHTTSKYFAVLLCFLLAFFCNLQATRYFAHVSFLVTSPWSQGKTEHIEHVARLLNKGSFFWSLGMRAYYFSFPLLLWIFGCIAMFACCIVLAFILYFLDTTNHFGYEEYSTEDNVESQVTIRSRNSSNSFSLTYITLAELKAFGNLWIKIKTVYIGHVKNRLKTQYMEKNTRLVIEVRRKEKLM
ncbi:hypothetical protein V2J09_020391 [Rumex salicifolius]